MTSSLKKFSAYVGLDQALKKDDVCIQTKGSRERKFEVMKHSPEAIDEWLTYLHSEVWTYYLNSGYSFIV